MSSDYVFFVASSLILVLACFFCSIMLWVFSKNSWPKKVLGFTLVVATLYNAYFQFKTIHSAFAREEILDFSYSVFCIFLLYAIYLYLRLLMRKKEKGNKPLVLQAVCVLVFYIVLYVILNFVTSCNVNLYSFDSIAENLNKPIVWLRIVVYLHYLVLLMSLCVATIRMYRRHKKEIDLRFSYRESITLSWIPFMVGLFIIAGFCTLIDIGQPYINPDTRIVYNIGYSVFYLTISFVAASQKDIYTHSESIIEKDNPHQAEDESAKTTAAIPPATRMQLKNNLIILMEKDKVYLNPDLRLDFVIKTLGTNRTYLSLLLKEDFGKNFMEFINYYRIEEAKQLLSKANNRTNLSEVAEIAGFKSISSFNIFFKRFTGQTPTEFRKTNGSSKSDE